MGTSSSSRVEKKNPTCGNISTLIIYQIIIGVSTIHRYWNFHFQGHTSAIVTGVSVKAKEKERPIALNTVELMRVSSSGLSMGPHHAMMIAEKWVREEWNTPRPVCSSITNSFLQNISRTQEIHSKVLFSKWFCFPRLGFTLRVTSVTLGQSLPSTTRTLTWKRSCVNRPTTPTGDRRFENCSQRVTSNQGNQTVFEQARQINSIQNGIVFPICITLKFNSLSRLNTVLTYCKKKYFLEHRYTKLVNKRAFKIPPNWVPINTTTKILYLTELSPLYFKLLVYESKKRTK